MDAFAHIDAWHSFLRVGVSALSTSLILLAFTFVVLFGTFFRSVDILEITLARLWSWRFRPAFALGERTPLAQAFSDGILNPKPF